MTPTALPPYRLTALHSLHDHHASRSLPPAVGCKRPLTTAPLKTPVSLDQAPSEGLPRRLGFWATTAIVVGTIIGSGIFRVPATVASEVGSPTAIALVWVLGGVISLCGALALAELAAAYPASGGVFV
jgi:amino acid permease